MGMVPISDGDRSGQTHSRTLNISISGSFDHFHGAGQESATWTTQNGRIADIMGVSDLLDGAGDKMASTALLKNALLTRCTLIEYKNDIPISLGINLSCLNGRECTRTGAQYAFTALPTHANTNPC